MSKTELWDALGKTDPAHTKAFKRAGGFSGTALKPMWVWKRLTECFGPFGTGWGCGEPSFQVVPADKETLVYCTVSAWHGERSNVIWGVGGDKAVSVNKYGARADDEAFKKAFTDALMNAFKFIGVGADIHMGLFDDNKYVAQVRDEFREQPAVKNPSVSVHPEGPDWWGAEGFGMSASQAKKEGWGDTFDKWLGEIPTIPTAAAWKDWCAEHAADIKRLPKGWRIQIREEAEVRGRELGAISTDHQRAA